METTIIECAKIQAETATKNRWTNSIKDGKVIHKGDYISVEGIAINSIGVGGDIIEIPESIEPPLSIIPTNRPGIIDLKSDTYEPNEFQFNFSIYLHHNLEDTCRLPFGTQYNAGTNIGSVVDTNQAIAGQPNEANPLVGTLKGDPASRFNQKPQDIKPLMPNNQELFGTRFYWVDMITEQEGTNNEESLYPAFLIPTNSQYTTPPQATFGGYSWRKMTTDLRVKVDKGYDSPENIATTINNQLNQTWIESAENATFGYTTENAVNSPPNPGNQLSTTKGSIISIPVNGNGIKPNGNYWYSGTFYKNPEYICAMFNLLTPQAPKTRLKGLANNALISSPADILSVGNMTNNGATPPIADIPNGEILITNLEFLPANLTMIKKLFYSQDGIINGMRIDNEDPANPNLTSENANWDYISKHPEMFYRYMPVGRADDTGAGLVISNLISNGGPYSPMVDGNVESSSFISYYISYTDERWEGSTLPAIPGGAQNAITSFEKVETFITGGTELKCREMAKAYNLNVVAIKVNSTDGNFDDNALIGIPLRPLPASRVCPAIHYGDFVLGDSAFSRPGNEAIKPIGWKTNLTTAIPATPGLEYFESQLQVGANNPTFQFNESLGRFQFSNLHFPFFTGSSDSSSGVASALDAIIRMNSKGQRFFNTDARISMLYARSGLAIESYSLKTKTGRWDRIEPYESYSFLVDDGNLVDDTIITNPEDYWSKNLMFRLGWNYDDMFPKYGLPGTIFTTNTYGKYPELVLYNPVQEFPNAPTTLDIIAELYNQSCRPFTTNPYFSSALSTAFSVNNANQPMLDLHYQRGAGYEITAGPVANMVPSTPAPIKIDSVNTTASSANLSASRLPRKLEYPYWLVYSDIIGNVKFLGVKGQPNNIMAVANRAYTSGDFAFNFATDYVFQATRDFVITQITTEIYNPDYTKSAVDDGTIILYKIQHPLPAVAPLQPGQRAVQVRNPHNSKEKFGKVQGKY